MPAWPPFRVGSVWRGLRKPSAPFRDRGPGPIMLLFPLKLLRCKDHRLRLTEGDTILTHSVAIPLKNPLHCVFSTSWTLLSLGIKLRRGMECMLLERSKLGPPLAELNSVKTQCDSFGGQSALQPRPQGLGSRADASFVGACRHTDT